MATVVTSGDLCRPAVETFIRSKYAAEYGARLARLPERILCSFATDGQPICAAGLRDSNDGFFSELYLDRPVESCLSEGSRETVGRDAIFEVSTLVSRVPQLTPDFISAIVSYGYEQGFSWSFFTVTRRLSILLHRMGLAPLFLAKADADRVPDRSEWGSYYDADPRVLAVSSRSVSALLNPRLAA